MVFVVQNRPPPTVGAYIRYVSKKGDDPSSGPWIACVMASKKLHRSSAKKSKRPASKKQQAADTRRELLRLARTDFASSGYAGLSLERLVGRAGLTRGALYHQFEDKKDLFRAVLEEVQGDVVRAIEKAYRSVDDPWQGLRLGCHAFVETAARPGIRKILLVDGPAVLGWQEWRRIDAENGVKELRAGLEELMEAGILRKLPGEALSYMLSGAMNEAALWLAEQKRPNALSDARRILDVFLESLLVSKSKARP